MTPPLIWLDLETTGLDPHRDEVLEVALLATDEDLVPLEYPTLEIVINHAIPPRSYRGDFSTYRKEHGLNLSTLDPFIVDMHSKNGLFADVVGKGVHPATAQDQIVHWLDVLANNTRDEGATGELDEKEKFLMAGSTISQFDRQFFSLLVGSRKLNKYFQYRVLDVSTIKEIARRWYGEAALFPSPMDKPHRALADIEHSIAELHHYRFKIFKSRDAFNNDLRRLDPEGVG